MKIFKFLSAELKDAKPAAGQDASKYYLCKVVEDTTKEVHDLQAVYGNAAFNMLGASKAYNTVIFDSNANYAAVAAWAEAKKANPDTAPLMLIKGETEIRKTAVPYYLKNAKGDKILDPTGAPKIADEVTFFCPDGDSATSILRSISNRLEFVAIVAPNPAEADVLG